MQESHVDDDLPEEAANDEQTVLTSEDAAVVDSGISEAEVNATNDTSNVGESTNSTTNNDQSAIDEQPDTPDCVDSSTIGIAGESVILNGDASVLEISEPIEPSNAADANGKVSQPLAEVETNAASSVVVEEPHLTTANTANVSAAANGDGHNVCDESRFDSEQVRNNRS